MLSKFSKYELGLVHYIAKFTILRFVILGFDCTIIFSGKINGQTLGPSLSAHDCFELGRQHYNSGDYDHTILWMKEAQKRLDEEQLKGQETVERTDILEYIAFSYYSLEDMKRALHYTNELLGMISVYQATLI